MRYKRTLFYKAIVSVSVFVHFMIPITQFSSCVYARAVIMKTTDKPEDQGFLQSILLKCPSGY